MDDVTRSSKLHPFTVEDMFRFAGEAWGELGIAIVTRWCQFNDGALRPVPLVITNTQPFGNRLAFCSYGGELAGRTITLNIPKNARPCSPTATPCSTKWCTSFCSSAVKTPPMTAMAGDARSCASRKSSRATRSGLGHQKRCAAMAAWFGSTHHIPKPGRHH